MAWREWSSIYTEPNGFLIGYQVLAETEAHDTDANSYVMRNRCIATWKWPGVTEATARYHCHAHRPDYVNYYTSALNDYFFLTNGVPVVGEAHLHVDNIEHNDTLLRGWHFMVWPDPTIYTITTDATVSGNAATLKVSPTVTPSTARQGDGAEVYFFKVQDVSMVPLGGGGWDIVQVEEFVTNAQTIGQPYK